MAPLRTIGALLLVALLCVDPRPASAAAPAATEQQVKAVFVFNFSHFVDWPPDRFASPTAPFVIGVVGGEPVAAQLDVAVHGERVGQHPLQVRRVASAEECRDCHIVYIDKSEGARLNNVLSTLGRGTLTVSDFDGAAQRGVMIQLATDNSRVHLLINVDSARAANLTINSNLLRSAQIVRTGGAP
jgi:hypothetical protein